MLIFSVGAIFLVVIIVVAYIAIYNYIINQRLRNNITDGRKWPAPHGMLKAALILVLVIVRNSLKFFLILCIKTPFMQ